MNPMPKASPSPIIDGVIDDEIWQAAAKIERFFLLGGEGWPKAKTRALLFYDDAYLYVGFICDETERQKPITGRGSIWSDDEIEIFIDANRDRKTYRQIIVNARGEVMELCENGTTHVGVKAGAYIEAGRRWMVEVAIPFTGLGVKAPEPGDIWRMNLCRHRPPGAGFGDEYITWAPAQKGFRELENFGKLIFGR